jgi:predicted phosphohydrolase
LLRIAFASDLHRDASPWNEWAIEELARRFVELRPEVTVIVGDLGEGPEAVGPVLERFARVPGLRLFVPGNHDLWVTDGLGSGSWDSRRVLDEFLPAVCRECGFHPLWMEAVSLRGVGFVGNLGWYDGSLADPRHPLSPEAYRRGEWEGGEWADRRWTRWLDPGDPSRWLEDDDVVAEMTRRLEQHIRLLGRRVDRIVAAIHTCPTARVVPRSEPPDPMDAYMGSERLGKVLERYERVTHCLGGHKHASGDWDLGGYRLHRRVLGSIRSKETLDRQVGSAVGVLEL